MVDGRLAKPRLVLGVAMAGVMGFSRMDIVIVPSQTCTRKGQLGRGFIRSALESRIENAIARDFAEC